MTYRFYEKDPGTAYISNNLLLPKAGVNLAPVKTALTFTYGEEEIRDEITGELIMTRPGEMRLWDENQNHIIVPREFIQPSKYAQFRVEFRDIRPKEFPAVELPDNIELRDEDQRRSFQALCANYSGTLNLACGKGKTVLALKLAAHLKVPTIVVVNTTALLEQWKKEAKKFFGLKKVGVIQGTTADWEGHPIVLAMVHTLSQRRDLWPMKFRRRFGLVLYDEGHHMSAPVFVRSADLFFGRRYSLTATARRIDGLESIYQYHLGPIIHTDLEQELIPRTYFHRLKWEFDLRYKPRVSDSNGDFNLPRIRTYLGDLDWRNRLIGQDIIADFLKGRTILVLSHSVEHVTNLQNELMDWDVPSGVITGATPQESRMKILSDSNPVLGTFQLAREGLDKPTLDTLYVVTPFSSPNDLQQAWGRIQRMYDGKMEPLVRVYEDLAFNQCKTSCRSLRSHLDGMGYPHRNLNIDPEELYGILES
jgi:superfamily II DNA or RNA helicase